MLADVMNPSHNHSNSDVSQSYDHHSSRSRSSLSTQDVRTEDGQNGVATESAMVRSTSTGARSVGGVWPIDHEAAKTTAEGSTFDGDGNFYPEGGKEAWLVVFGSFIGMVACFGLMNTIGIFQAYVSDHQLQDYDESTISWIFSVYVFLSFGCGIQIGPVFDAYGPKLLMLAGSILLSLSMLLIGICTEYYQWMLVFGVMGGMGTSLIFTPAVSALGHFFMQRRGLATGLAAAGGGIGGVIFPLMLRSLFESLSFAWATRILGLIFVVCTGISVVLVRSRLPPKPGQSVFPDLRIFRRKSFALVTLGVYMMEWGLFIPIAYITSFALDTPNGVFTTDFAYQLLAILNAGSVLGRWLPGWLADRMGRFNLMTAALALCGLTTLALWLPAAILVQQATESGEQVSMAVKPLTIVFGFVFGLASGSNLGVTPVCVGQLCATEEYGRYYATCYTVVSFGTLTGIPIAGALLQICNGNYWGLIVFTGASYIVSVVAFAWARGIEVGWGWKTIF